MTLSDFRLSSGLSSDGFSGDFSGVFSGPRLSSADRAAARSKSPGADGLPAGGADDVGLWDGAAGDDPWDPWMVGEEYGRSGGADWPAEGAGPEDGAPEDGAPDDAGCDGRAGAVDDDEPDDPGPDDAGPDDAGPDDAGPDDAGPDGPGADWPGPERDGADCDWADEGDAVGVVRGRFSAASRRCAICSSCSSGPGSPPSDGSGLAPCGADPVAA
ncbi:hypothetical protein [Microbaculum marinum]|uniref:Uncharacterized protein n=1 Tax=Microbaculum marinum TaxID=1764581 RepID=A0AAW9RVE9_9HYPH